MSSTSFWQRPSTGCRSSSWSACSRRPPSTITTSSVVDVWPNNAPILLQLLLATLIVDFFKYWYHRWTHEVPLLWRIHSIHHSLDRLEMLRASYFYPIDIFLTVGTGTLAMLMIGARYELIIFHNVFAGITGLLNHSNADLRLRLLRLDSELARTSSRASFGRSAGRSVELRELLQLHGSAVRHEVSAEGPAATSIRSDWTRPIGCRAASWDSSPCRFAGDALVARRESSRARQGPGEIGGPAGLHIVMSPPLVARRERAPRVTARTAFAAPPDAEPRGRGQSSGRR